MSSRCSSKSHTAAGSLHGAWLYSRATSKATPCALGPGPPWRCAAASAALALAHPPGPVHVYTCVTGMSTRDQPGTRRGCPQADRGNQGARALSQHLVLVQSQRTKAKGGWLAQCSPDYTPGRLSLWIPCLASLLPSPPHPPACGGAKLCQAASNRATGSRGQPAREPLSLSVSRKACTGCIRARMQSAPPLQHRHQQQHQRRQAVRR